MVIDKESLTGLITLEGFVLPLISQQRVSFRYYNELIVFFSLGMKLYFVPTASTNDLLKLIGWTIFPIQEAVKGELWRLCDPQGKPPGVMGWWPSRSVTFIENHDTGSTQVYLSLIFGILISHQIIL